MNPLLIKSTRSGSNNLFTTDSSCQQVQIQMIHLPLTHKVDRYKLKRFTYRTLSKSTGSDSKHSLTPCSTNQKVQIQKFSYTPLSYQRYQNQMLTNFTHELRQGQIQKCQVGHPHPVGRF